MYGYSIDDFSKEVVELILIFCFDFENHAPFAGDYVQAMRLIWERLKIIVEPSCAVPFAAVLKEKSRFAGKRVGIILSGGNVDLERVAKLFGNATT